MIDLNQAIIVNSPDVRAWSITSSITHLAFDNYISRIDHTKANDWPDVIPPGFSGPIQFTWWLFLKLGDKWYGSGFLEMWKGRDTSGSRADPDVPSLYHKHWFYSPRWYPINTHGPIMPGEMIGMMVTSGDARDSKGPFGPMERSNIVVFPATDNGSFDFPDERALPIPPIPSEQPGWNERFNKIDNDLETIIKILEPYKK